MKTVLVAILWFMSMLNTGAAAEVQGTCSERQWTAWLWAAAAASKR